MLNDIENNIKEAVLLDFCIKLDSYIKENNKRMSQTAINQVISSIVGKPLYFKKTKKTTVKDAKKATVVDDGTHDKKTTVDDKKATVVDDRTHDKKTTVVDKNTTVDDKKATVVDDGTHDKKKKSYKKRKNNKKDKKIVFEDDTKNKTFVVPDNN